MDVAAIQSALREFGLDAWLLYDFRRSNVLAQRILGLADDQVGSRRYACCVPARGVPRKLVHRIEMGALDHIEGETTVYLRWQEWQAGLAKLLAGSRRVALEYSPENAIPYISRVDAGTLDLVRGCGVEPVSSGDLIQLFEAAWDDDQERSHFAAAVHTDAAYSLAWRLIASRVREGGTANETEIQQAILKHFEQNNLTTYSPPIVAVNENSGNPHYETGTGRTTAIREKDFVLIDLWAKLKSPRSVYSDLTRVGYVGASVPERYAKVFAVVAAGRDAAIDAVRDAFAVGRPIQGWEVDRAARDSITAAGYGKQFVHRTGHSIGQEVHGNGANMDDLETHETRLILPRTCFSIEPGVYLPEFGIRSEVNVYIDAQRTVHVTGGPVQQAVLPILA